MDPDSFQTGVYPHDYLELIQQLFAHGLEDRLEERAPKDEGGVVVGQGVAEGGHMAEAQPPRVVDLEQVQTSV